MRKFFIAVAIVTAGLVATTANFAAGATPTAAAASKGGALAAFNTKITQLVNDSEKPQTERPPTSGPPAAKNKSIVVIPCSMAAQGCSRTANALMQAASTLGWKATLLDPEGDATKEAADIRQAITLHPSAIYLGSIDASTQLGPIRAAKAAGIPIAAFGGVDTDNLFSVNEVTSASAYSQQGYLSAAAAYLGTGKHLKMLIVDDNEFASVTARANGAMKFVAQCRAAGGDCQILGTQDIQVANLATSVPQQIANFAQQYPTYNVLWAGYDALVPYAIQGLKEAGLIHHGFAVGEDANAPNVEIIHAGGYERYTVGLAQEWVGYAIADELNRLFQHKPQVNEGVTTKLIDKANAPASGSWDGDFSVAPLYKKIWGK